MYSDLPDYYLGKLLYFDDCTDDNCRWVVYDGHSKVRCATRRDAIDYIQSHSLVDHTETMRRMIYARTLLARAMMMIDAAADRETAATQLLLRRLAVTIRPIIIEIDNITLKHYDSTTTTP